jgi:hypothetical protein
MLSPDPELPPVILPVTIGADQLYVVPIGTNPLVTFVGVEVKETPLQTVFVMGVIAGLGITVIVSNELIAPLHV